jgi:hypothetical protein
VRIGVLHNFYYDDDLHNACVCFLSAIMIAGLCACIYVCNFVSLDSVGHQSSHT